MSKHRKTKIILDMAGEILAEHHPMTVRQVYYQLVSRQVIKNNRGQYQAVSNALVWARKEEIIPWEWIEDRLRRPREVSMWDNLSDFGNTVLTAYRLNTWINQPCYFEFWLEKDALSGLFEALLKPYGVTLNVGRGYDGWDSIRNAANRLGVGEETAILYFGDFDPSGEDMVRSLKERLRFFECEPEICKCALTFEDVKQYNLPPDFTKASDTRSKGFIAKYGDIAVELDALPSEILKERIIEAIEERMDLDELESTKRTEEIEKERLSQVIREF